MKESSERLLSSYFLLPHLMERRIKMRNGETEKSTRESHGKEKNVGEMKTENEPQIKPKRRTSSAKIENACSAACLH